MIKLIVRIASLSCATQRVVVALIYGKLLGEESVVHAHIEDFSTKDKRHSGGKTGSSTVKKGKDNYQLKSSILDAPLERKLKARYSDNENFADCIASKVLEFVTGSNQENAPELIAQGTLVIDEEKQRILFASRHIKNLVPGATLEGYAKRQVLGLIFTTPKDKHVKISFKESGEAKDVFYMGGDDPAKKLLRKDVVKALACSMISGDHDVNPGNMVAFTDKAGNIRVARIDFGHAFNDLLAGPKVFGGRARNTGNAMLDFMNRDTLIHLAPSNQKTKLWRDYVDIVPSAELAEAFREVSAEKEQRKAGVRDVCMHFLGVLQELEKDPEKNKEVINHMIQSLISINNTITDKRIYITTPHEDVLLQVFANIDHFYSENQKQMEDVAKLMNLQVKIDELLVAKKNDEKLDNKLIAELNRDYEYLRKAKGIRSGHGIEWIKSDADTKDLKGTLHDFIIKRGEDLGVDLDASRSLAQKDFQAEPLGLFQKIDNAAQDAVDSIQSIFSKVWKCSCYIGLAAAVLVAVPFAILAWPFTGSFSTAIGAVMSGPAFCFMAIADLATEIKDFFTHFTTEEERRSHHSFKTEVDKVIVQEATAKRDEPPAGLELKTKPISHQEQVGRKVKKELVAGLKRRVEPHLEPKPKRRVKRHKESAVEKEMLRHKEDEKRHHNGVRKIRAKDKGPFSITAQ